MSTNVKVSGAWNEIASAWAKISGTWQEANSIWVKVAGTWQKVYQAWQLIFSGTTSNTALNNSGNATAEVKFATDGYVYFRDNLTGGYTQVGQWISDVTEAATSGAEIRWTNAVGDTMTSWTTAEDVWHDITASDLVLYITDTDGGAVPNVSVTFDMQVRDADDVLQDTESYTLTANYLI